MDVPEIPIILTESDWNKKKGAIAKAAGKTGIGPLIKDMTTAYHRVDWETMDVEKVLDPGDTAAQDTAALAVAKRQYQAHLPPLLKKIEALEDQARLTQAKFAKNKLIPGSTTKHVGSLADAAKKFAEDVKAVEDDLEKFEKDVAGRVKEEKDAKAKQKQQVSKAQTTPSVKDVAGEKWFAGLAKVSLHRDPAIARWAFNPDIAASANDALFRLDRRFDPRGVQARFETHLKKFRVTLEQLKSLQDKTLERKEAVGKLQAGMEALVESFETGLLSAGDLLEALKALSGRAENEYDAWVSAHPDILRQTEQAVAVLKKQQPLLKELNEFAQKLKKA